MAISTCTNIHVCWSPVSYSNQGKLLIINIWAFRQFTLNAIYVRGNTLGNFP